MITTILSTLIAALVIAIITSLTKSHGLYAIVPKLYFNTPISNGQVISLSIYNAALFPEEDIAITFRPTCKIDIIGTTKSTAVLNNQTLTLPKLSRFENVNILLLIEGKTFDPADIESIESKKAKGKVVDDKSKAYCLWQHFIAIPAILLLLGLPFVFGSVVGVEMGVSIPQYLDDQYNSLKPSTELAGYTSNITEGYATNSLESSINRRLIMFAIKNIVRQGNILTVKIEIKNKLDTSILIHGDIKSSAGDKGSVSFEDARFDSISIMPSESQTIKMKAYLPDDVKLKLLQSNFYITSINGDSANASQIIQLR